MSKQLLKRLNEIDLQLTILRNIYSVLDWDQKTIMPKDGIEARSLQFAEMAKQLHQVRTSKEVVAIVKALQKPSVFKTLSATDKMKVKLHAKELKRFTCLPTKFVEDFAKAAAESESAWEDAREKNDFAIFAPHLQKMLDMKLQECKYIDAKKHPYDVLLDDYQEGLTVQRIKAVFDPLKVELKSLYAQIKAKKQKAPQIQSLSIEKQKQICEYLQAKILPFPTKTVQAQSVHPFMNSVGPDDVRITTAFRESDPFFAITSTAHECGHALYELQFNQKFKNTILFAASSYTAHESQSRLWENHIVKSFKFWRKYFAKIKAENPQLKDVDAAQFYKALNEVTGSLIRIEGDEVTYCLHIIIRFELELQLLEKKLTIEKLPQAWNAMYQEYFGEKPKTDAQGVLQDVHWSSGSFGYFPTYALGTMYASMIFVHLHKIRPQLDEEIADHNFAFIQTWLRKNIHQISAMKTTEPLMKKAIGKDLDPKVYVAYLNTKYGKIYGL
ncbi:MAG TPA: carboxypeptidase M32 [Acidobacteriota bacterium]|nr:carboxypeptidase M32 [Acidobacteriota bacterium]